MSRRIAVITGANKGIGKAIARNLILRTSFPLHVYMTGRNLPLVEAACKDLHSESAVKSALQKKDSAMEAKQMDITDEVSIQKFADYLKATYVDEFDNSHGILDILINNAGIATKGSTFNHDIVKSTVGCNYYGTQKVCEIMIPLLKRDEKARVVNVSSVAGRLSNLPSDKLKMAFSSPDLTMDQLDRLIKRFYDDVEAGNHTASGWPSSAYVVSKVGLTAMSNILAREHPDILINSCCPGWVKTDMGGDRAHKTTDEGSNTPVLLAIGDIGTTTGKFWENDKVIKW